METKNAKKQFEPKVKNVPNSEELERSILSVIMSDKDAAQDIFAKVDVKDFYTARHQIIYAQMQERNHVGASFDFIGISTSMTAEQKEKIGGASYLTEVASAAYSSATYLQDVEALKQLAALRSLLKIADVVENRVYNNEDSDSIVSFAQGELFNLKSANEVRELEIVSTGTERVIGDIQELYLSGERKTGLSTGFKNLDKLANGGFLPGQMIVLAARPGCGKTSFAMNIVSNVARANPDKVIAVFNLEMAKDELIKRLLSTVSGVDSKLISSGYNLSNEQMNKLYAAQKTISSTKIYLDDSSNISMNDIQLKVRRLQAQENRLDLVVIDHMQLIADTSSRSRSRYEMMTDISRRVKILAKEVGVPVIVLSQMSRDFEKDDNRQALVQGQPARPRDPKMSDLRESGAIEQDADMILFLTPGDFVVAENEAALNVVVAKNRSGEADLKLNYAWIKSEMRFEEKEHVTPVQQQEQQEETEKEEVRREDPNVQFDDFEEPIAPPEDYGAPSDLLSEIQRGANPDGASRFNNTDF